MRWLGPEFTPWVAVHSGAALATAVITYTYDGLLRLTGAVEDPGTTYAYAYDMVGNRTDMWTNGTLVEHHDFNAADQVVGWTYDAAGNLLDDGTATFTYDALSRMLTTTKGSEQRANTYNGDGTLVAQTANGTITHFTQDLVSPLSQILQTTQGTTTKHYVYGHERLYKQAGIVKTWYGGDALGSVRQTLDEAGAPLSTLNYDPWGTPEGGVTPPVFGFAGEWQDAGVGLVNLRARWYAPGQGRFTARDPFAGFDDRPYSLHPYQYAYSDPVSNTDPSGWCPLGPDGKPLPCRNPGPVPPSPVPPLPPVATGGSGDSSLCRLPGTPVGLGAAAPALTALPIRPRPPLYVVPRQPVAPNPGPGILAWLGRLLPIVGALPLLSSQVEQLRTFHMRVESVVPLISRHST